MTAEEFFQELNRLIAKRPKDPTQVLHSENIEWGQNVYYSQNLYWAFDTVKSSDGGYLYDSVSMVRSWDCDYCQESELCYDSVDAFRCYNCDSIQNSANMRDSAFSVYCSNCHDVFGCVGLKNKSFCLFNRQLSETEYRQQAQTYRQWPAEKVLATVKELRKGFPITQTNEMHNENSSYGNYVYYCKNCYMCFDTATSEDSGYLYVSNDTKNCYDTSYSVENQLSYEVTDSGTLFNCDHIVWSANCWDSSYLFDCANLKNCLGCAGLNHKEHMLLNRQLTKEEYERISKEILEDIHRKNLGWANLVYVK